MSVFIPEQKFVEKKRSPDPKKKLDRAPPPPKGFAFLSPHPAELGPTGTTCCSASRPMQYKDSKNSMKRT